MWRASNPAASSSSTSGLPGGSGPGRTPIGRRLRWGLDVPQNRNPWLTIVGVVADVADGALGSDPFIHAYEPFSQFPDGVLNNVPNAFGRHVKLAVRTNDDPRALIASVRGEMRSIDRQLAIESIETMEDRLGESVAPRRFSVLTLGAFAAGSLLLAAIGLYGLLAFNVAERRREIAVRIALGAEPPAILRMVVGQGLKLVAIGLVAVRSRSFWVARALTSLLYQTETHDAVTFASVPVVLGSSRSPRARCRRYAHHESNRSPRSEANKHGEQARAPRSSRTSTGFAGWSTEGASRCLMSLGPRL